jgi:MFS family permease
VWSSCKEKDFCETSIQYQIDWSHESSLKNWYYDLNLTCAPSLTIGLIGVCYLIGAVIGLCIFPRLSDIIGRKKIFYSGMAAYLILLILLLSVSNLYLYYCLTALNGLGSPARFLIGYIYLGEMLPNKWVPIISSIGIFIVS